MWATRSRSRRSPMVCLARWRITPRWCSGAACSRSHSLAEVIGGDAIGGLCFIIRWVPVRKAGQQLMSLKRPGDQWSQEGQGVGEIAVFNEEVDFGGGFALQLAIEIGRAIDFGIENQCQSVGGLDFATDGV